MQQDVYVSITGLQVRRVWHIPSFWSHRDEIHGASAQGYPATFRRMRAPSTAFITRFQSGPTKTPCAPI
jgi:hypothetical protein